MSYERGGEDVAPTWEQPELWDFVEPAEPPPAAAPVPAADPGTDTEPAESEPAAPVVAGPVRPAPVALADLPADDGWARAAVGVVDAEAVWLPSGHGVQWRVEDGLAGLLSLAEVLPLRVSARTPTLPSDGGLVLLPGAVRALGWPVRVGAPDMDTTAAQALTDAAYADVADSPAYASLGPAGWSVPAPAAWMTFRRDRDGGRGFRQLRVSVPSWGECQGTIRPTFDHLTFARGLLADAPDRPGIEGLTDPISYAKRMQLFADALAFPWWVTHANTGRAYIAHSRRRAASTKNAPHSETEVLKVDPAVAVAWGRCEGALTWHRAPTADETSRSYLHGYDLNAAYLAAAGGMEVGYGQPVYVAGDDARFSAKVAGIWHVNAPRRTEDSGWTMPDLITMDSRGGDTRWRTTPTLAFAERNGRDIDVIEAWIWPRKGRYLDTWYERINAARLSLAQDPSDDASAALAALKLTYAATHGRLARARDYGVTPLGRPDWAAAWIATARTNLLRKIAAAGELGFWPIAIQTDALIYASDESDPTAALPAPLKLDPLALGAFKHIGRIDTTAALPLIGTPDLWEALKGRPPVAERPAAGPGGEGSADAELVAYGPDYSNADYWDDE